MEMREKEEERELNIYYLCKAKQTHVFELQKTYHLLLTTYDLSGTAW